MARSKAVLILEDGTIFEGESFGATGERAGEVVFNTSMTGYQEILTDPSYKGQIVTMTYPHIGNYGINLEDAEAWQPYAEALIVREVSPVVSNWRSTQSLDELLRQKNVLGITDLDTRALVRHIRAYGAMKGYISTEDFHRESLLQKVTAAPGMIGRDLVMEVTCAKPYIWTDLSLPLGILQPVPSAPDRLYHVVAYDFGIKHNILRLLADRGCRITVVPANFPAEKVLEMHPDGLFLSNGPGDPAAVDYAVRNLRVLVGEVPTLGICLGHQLLGLAFGGQTYKLKFGHHGGNQPVKNLLTDHVEITAHNHGFAVDPDSLPPEVEITHINLNDQCVEGMRHRSLPVFCVQYHPEASPGPHDARYLFDQFIDLMRGENTSWATELAKTE
ncbi:MAG: glutamine-hydrolyzing carbamoyl-phosphate synthase small subunit [Chloroflexi bacterium]|nr:glutamine-hydrolyzing carbamoyl-phosphate synthase small subunit [Chloroflexota bacterium]